MSEDTKATNVEKPEKKKKSFGVNFKVSAKGAVSVYGLGRFPVTLYREQWVRLLERTDDLRKFMEEHAGDLKAKGDQSATPVEPSADAPAGEVTEIATTLNEPGAPTLVAGEGANAGGSEPADESSSTHGLAGGGGSGEGA